MTKVVVANEMIETGLLTLQRQAYQLGVFVL